MAKINLPPIDPKYKILGIVGIAALLIMGYYDHLYKPHAKTVTALREELAGLEDRVAIIKNLEYPRVHNHAEIMRLMEGKQTTLRTTIAAAEGRLASPADTSKLLEELTSLANTAGLGIRSLEPKPSAKDGEYMMMPLLLEVNAEFRSLVAFLEKTKDLPVVLEQMQISVRERPQLSARLVLRLYMK